ncbi:MAG TPA: aldehyde dehydrogenase family protein [Trebonia sp.]|jgi:acyl-CoA reductase-like NAD-dependent aldehyde dehydrogenase|nr:aldehyde dehydrogenase family protein [Trebonia sp.]
MNTKPPAPYDGFDRMPIGGQWRPGSAGRELTDTDPWSGDVLTRIPLASAADAERGVQFALRLQAGMTHVNDSPVNEEDNTAYGGEKLSGLGRFGGTWSIDEFTTHHWVSVQHTHRPYPMPAPA